MGRDLFTGELVRLVAEDPQTIAEAYNRWGRDSEYLRLMDWGPARWHSVKSSKEWIEKELEKDDLFFFMIRTLEDDRLIGDIGLGGLQWNLGEAWAGIAIGERETWGKGYGTDAMHILLRYAFCELNLHRVTLNVFEYNQRAIRSYEKAGFVVEGRERQFMQRGGRRWDVVYMGILRQEWEKLGS
jgi:RimJ/RimL family protein N-acetyltransferase